MEMKETSVKKVRLIGPHRHYCMTIPKGLVLDVLGVREDGYICKHGETLIRVALDNVEEVKEEK